MVSISVCLPTSISCRSILDHEESIIVLIDYDSSGLYRMSLSVYLIRTKFQAYNLQNEL